MQSLFIGEIQFILRLGSIWFAELTWCACVTVSLSFCVCCAVIDMIWFVSKLITLLSKLSDHVKSVGKHISTLFMHKYSSCVNSWLPYQIRPVSTLVPTFCTHIRFSSRMNCLLLLLEWTCLYSTLLSILFVLVTTFSSVCFYMYIKTVGIRWLLTTKTTLMCLLSVTFKRQCCTQHCRLTIFHLSVHNSTLHVSPETADLCM